MGVFKATAYQKKEDENKKQGSVFKGSGYRSYDKELVSQWQASNAQSLGVLKDYENRINKGEWLDEEDRKTYKSAIDSYIQTANSLRGINRMFGEGFSDEDEKAWTDGIASLNKGYEDITSVFSKFANATEYSHAWNKEKTGQEFNSVLSAPDLDEYVQKGIGVSNPTWNKAQAPVSILGWTPFGDGDDIGNMVTFAEENKLKGVQASLSAMQGGGGSQYTELVNLINEHMKDDEKRIYNYYVGKGETEKAKEYLEYVTDVLRQRAGGKIAEKVNGTGWEAVTSGAAGVGSWISGMRNLDNYITGKEADPTTALQYAQNEMSKDNEGVWKTANDLLYTTGNMAPSILVSMIPYIGAVAGKASFGASAVGNAYSEMRNLGYNEWQSRGYATAVGASEVVLQSLLGGISKLGGSKSLSAGITKLVGKFDNALAKFAISMPLKMGSEALEEGIQTVLEPAFKALMTGEKFEAPEWEEVLYSALLGALSAGTLEGIPGAVGDIYTNYKTETQMGGMSVTDAFNAFFKGDKAALNIDNPYYKGENGTKGFKGVAEAYKTGKQNVKEMASAHVGEALEIDPDNAHAQRMQARLDSGKSVSGYQIDRIIHDSENTLVSQDKGKIKSAVEARLTELGETGNVAKLADIIVKAISKRNTIDRTNRYLATEGLDERLTKSERAILMDSKYGRRVSTEMNPDIIESGDYSSAWAEGIGTDRINAEAYGRMLAQMDEETAPQAEAPTAPQAETAPVTENAPIKENAAEGEIKASANVDQKATATMLDSEGNEVSVNPVKFTEIGDGEATIELEGGQTVKADSVAFKNSGVGFVYQAATEMASGVGGFNVDAANVMVRGVSPDISEEDASLYVAAFNEAYRYGAMGYPVSALETRWSTAFLSEKQRETAYSLGKIYGEGKVSAKQANIDRAKAESAGKPHKKGRVYFDGSAAGKNLTERQRASLKGLRVVAEAMGVDIHIFQSEVVDNVRQGANGWYDPSTKEIHLDLHAGIDGNGLMLYTASHELTHHIKNVSPAKFKAFSDALLEEYTKNGQSIDRLVASKLEFLDKKGRTDGLTEEQAYDLALEEVVADACEAMLVDSGAIEIFSRKIKSKDKSLWETIKEFIDKLVARIRAAYEGVDPDSVEGKLMREMKDSAERLQKLWVEAALDAAEAYPEVAEALGKGASLEVNEKGEFTVGQTKDGTLLYNDRTYEEGGRETLEKTLREEGFSEDDIWAALVIMDAKHDLVRRLGEEFAAQGEVNRATLVTDVKHGHSALSALVKNGDYPVNIDLSTVCKKRQAYQRVINRLCESGLIKQATLDSLAIAEINKILGKYGFETACLGCFVESKRLRIQEYAQTVCKEWNSLVEKKVGKENAKDFGFAKDTFVTDLTDEEIDRLTEEYEKAVTKEGNVNVGTGSYLKKFEKLMDSVPSLQKRLTVSDIATPKGMANLKSVSPELFALVASRYGSGTPKPVQSFNPYNSELAVYGSKPKKYASLREYLYAIGGARMQSFSDFIVENWFDYCQIVADLTARKLPMHTYTKEITLAKLFGMTGIKVNMSLIPDIDTSLGSEYAGLTKNANGEYELIWSDKDRFKATGGKSYMQSINFADAVALQSDPRYSANVGTIAIGISDNHIRVMLDDSRIRMIIPYHKSNINPIFAKLSGIDYYKDYTDVQSTTVKELYDSNGKKADLKLTKKQKEDITAGFEFNEALQRLGDARAAAQEYIKWCADSSLHTIKVGGETYTATLTPKFEAFSDHTNYYKLLEDFNTYDNITEQAAPQGDVQQIYPDDFEQILRDELKARENYSKKQEPKWETAMGEIEDYLKTHTKAETKAYAKANNLKLKFSDRVTDRSSYAPTFYSHMGKVIDDVKLEKMGSASILNHLKNRGVKAEEIKWSGIEAFLEGKKSVTKAELQEFVAGSQLQIEEENWTGGANITLEPSLFGDDSWEVMLEGKVLDTYSWNEDYELYESENTGDIFETKEKILEYFKEKNGNTRWNKYKLDGGKNYREIVFRIPNATHTNAEMKLHWGEDAEGILAHARIQDLVTSDGKKMLFVEEIQSDWHNEGHKEGYVTKEYEDAVAMKRKMSYEHEKTDREWHEYIASGALFTDPKDVSDQKFNWYSEEERRLRMMKIEAGKKVDDLKQKGVGDTPDAPFRDNYHEYVLKRLIRMAAEEGYDSIGWTPSDIQSERWSETYAEGYRIEYDQDIPKFLRKYGKKWGATVGTSDIYKKNIGMKERTMKEIDLANEKRDLERAKKELARKYDSYEKAFMQRSIDSMEKTIATLEQDLSSHKVWSMDITDSMKNSVLYEGQVLYSDRVIPTGIELPEGTKVDKNGKPRSAQAQRDAGYMLSESKFYQIYSAHILTYGNRGGEINSVVEKIKRDGFISSTSNANVLPTSTMSHFNYDRDGRVQFSNVVQARYAPKKGDYVLFVPNNYVTKDDIIKNGFKPLDYEIGIVEYDYQTYYEVYKKAYDRAYKQTHEGQVLYSDRDPDSYSNRSLLAGALETAVQNDIERTKLEQYKQKIDRINSEEQKLRDLRAKIKELSFAKGPRDTEALKNLQFEANQTANRINVYDRQLLDLESTKALKGVLEREKKRAYQKAEQRGEEALEKQREGRYKTAVRLKIKNVVNSLNSYLLSGSKEKHVPIGLQSAVAEALNAVNMDTVGADKRIAEKEKEMMRAKTPEEIEKLVKEVEHIREMGGNLSAKLERLKTAYDDIINSDDPIVANSYDEVISNTIARVINEVGDTSLRDMSLHQLESVYDMYKMILATVRNTNKAFKLKKSEEISTVANRVIAELDEQKKRDHLQSDTAEALSSFDWNNQKPVYAFERIGSETFSDVFTSVREGEDVWAKDMDEAQAFLEEQKKKYNFKSWDFDKKYAFASTTGLDFSLSLGQIMSLYAFSKRGSQATDHLKYGGFVHDGLTEVKEKGKFGTVKTYKLKDSTAYNLSEGILENIISKLTDEQKHFADAMQDYLSTVMGEKGNEVSLALYDVKLFKEKNYFPLKSAPQFLERAREQAQGDVKIKNKGFTKETKPKAKNPIVLTSFMDVWAGHVNEMSMYHAFALPLEDFYRVYNYKSPASETLQSDSVISYLENAHGNASVAYIDQLLKDLNGGARSDSRENIFKSGVSNFKKAAVMASLSVVVQQPSAIVRATAIIDAKYFGGKKVSKAKQAETWAEIKKYAPVAIIKEMGYFDTGMGKSSVDWLKGEKTWKDKVDDVLSFLPGKADEITWCAIWNAVKRETAAKNTDLATSSEEFLKLAGERFTEVITKTQVYDSTLAKSANMRSKNLYMNMLTAFMAEPTTSINMLQDAFRKGGKKRIARAMGAVYGSVLLNSVLVSLVYAARDDDEDETYIEKYLSRLTTEVVDGVNPLTYLPFVKDIWSIAQGFDVERADMTLIDSFIDSFKQLFTVCGKDTDDMDEDELGDHRKSIVEAILSVVDNGASLLGIPEKNLRREIVGAINFIKTLATESGKMSAGSLGDNIVEDLKDSVPVWGWFPDKSKSDKLYDAIVKGDEKYSDRLMSGYKDQKEVDAALRKALRDNDPRIREAAEDSANGYGVNVGKIINEIISEGNFPSDIIWGAFAAELEKIEQDQNKSK